ncbi:MAG: dihydrofolate reductase family protein [Candidatus Nanohalobium sp.]
MKIKLFMSQSLNAKIARENGGEDFFSPRNWEEFQKIAENTGAFVVGRKTHEAVKEWEEKGFKDINAERIVLTRKKDFDIEEGYIKASSPRKAVQVAEEQGLESLLVTGGASVNTSFIEKGLLDELIIDIEPFLLGKGLDLFSKGEFEAELELEEVRELEEDIVQLRYSL